MSLLHRRQDPKLGELMIELRDTYARLSSVEQHLNNVLAENERLSEAIDHRGCYARIEELELELADLKSVEGFRSERERMALNRADRAEEQMLQMKAKLEEILTDQLEQLGR